MIQLGVSVQVMSWTSYELFSLWTRGLLLLLGHCGHVCAGVPLDGSWRYFLILSLVPASSTYSKSITILNH